VVKKKRKKSALGALFVTKQMSEGKNTTAVYIPKALLFVVFLVFDPMQVNKIRD